MRDSTRYEKVEEAPGITSGGLFGPYKFITLRSGRKFTMSDAIAEAETGFSTFMRGISRGFKLMSSEWDLDRIERELTHMEEYIHAVRHFLKTKEEEKAARERIAQLRNVTGRNPVETEAYLRKADELEAALPEAGKGWDPRA